MDQVLCRRSLEVLTDHLNISSTGLWRLVPPEAVEVKAQTLWR